MNAAGERQYKGDSRAHAATVTCALLALAGCQRDIADVDGIFDPGDGRRVHCAISIDDEAQNSVASMLGGLDRAADRGEIIELYGHAPGETISLGRLEAVLAGARDRGLPFYTYAQFARGEAHGPGLALSLDDSSIREWYAALPLFAQYDATLTFFVSRYAHASEDEHAMLREIAAAGHDLEPHTVNHVRAPDYVEAHGLTAYLEEEVLPSFEVMQADGYEISAFAYPFGSRTDETDRAILEHVPIVRSLAFAYAGVVQDPCPH